MKEAFDLIKERLEEESHYSCFHCMDRALSIVSEVEAEYGNGWIPCSERLPNRDSDCLVTYESGKIGIMEYLETSKWGWNGEFADNRVIAWMPLPEVYKPTND